MIPSEMKLLGKMPDWQVPSEDKESELKGIDNSKGRKSFMDSQR